MKVKLIFRLIFCLSIFITIIKACNRRPQGANGDSIAVDDKYRITVQGNPEKYIPGQRYNVTLSCDRAFRILSFTLVVESESGPTTDIEMTGYFELFDEVETRFSTICENMVENSNMKPKQRINVAWVAPKNPNSTCIYIKAGVLQHREAWYIDDGLLTIRLCPEEIDDFNSQIPLMNPCCACDEAKYELKLERLWSRNTHPKDFPIADRTSFSELIGASHNTDYYFWDYGTSASAGLQELAEYGATSELEKELKNHTKTGDVRTIIKAPGIKYRRNILGNTLATIRVDPQHHLVSFVTKIVPSPDWILGVAHLELCLANCTWIEKRELNLTPWDVGTDSGPTYDSPDERQFPADVIRRITSTMPNDERSPFCDGTSEPIKPLAKLYLMRKKIYGRKCEEDDSNDYTPLECATHPWIDWTECSTRCGSGIQYKYRSYKDSELAERYNCSEILKLTQSCEGTKCSAQDDGIVDENAECAITPWSSYSPCSASCGNGFKTRTRNYKNPAASFECQERRRFQLVEKEPCFGNRCAGTVDNDNIIGDFNRKPGFMEENYNGNYQEENQDYDQNKPDTNQYDENENEPNQYQNQNQNQIYDQYKPNRIQYNNYNNNNNNNNNNRNKPQSFQHQYNKQNEPEPEPNQNSYNEEETESVQNQNQYSNNRKNDYGRNRPYQQNKFSGRNTINYDDNSLNHLLDVDHTNTCQLTIRQVKNNLDEYPDVSRICFKRLIEPPYNCRNKPKNFWMYDATDCQCKLFATYDKCDENENRFSSLEECEEICLQPLLNLEEQFKSRDFFKEPFSNLNQDNRRQRNRYNNVYSQRN